MEAPLHGVGLMSAAASEAATAAATTAQISVTVA